MIDVAHAGLPPKPQAPESPTPEAPAPEPHSSSQKRERDEIDDLIEAITSKPKRKRKRKRNEMVDFMEDVVARKRLCVGGAGYTADVEDDDGVEDLDSQIGHKLRTSGA